MRIILLIVILSNTVTVYGQLDLTTPITLEVENINLEDLFKTLELKCGIVIAYGSDNIPSELRITIKARTTTLYEIIQIICSKANVSYQIIDSVIVFKYLGNRAREDVIKRQPPIPAEAQIKNPSGRTATSQITELKIDSISADARISPILFPPLQSQFRFEPEKVKPPEWKALSVRSMVPHEERSKKIVLYQTGLFFTYSVDFNHFDFVERGIAFQKYRREWNQSFGVRGYVVFSPKNLYFSGPWICNKRFQPRI